MYTFEVSELSKKLIKQIDAITSAEKKLGMYKMDLKHALAQAHTYVNSETNLLKFKEQIFETESIKEIFKSLNIDLTLDTKPSKSDYNRAEDKFKKKIEDLKDQLATTMYNLEACKKQLHYYLKKPTKS